MMQDMKDMFKEFWREMPTLLKVLWIGGMLATVAFFSVIVWAIISVVTWMTAS